MAQKLPNSNLKGFIKNRSYQKHQTDQTAYKDQTQRSSNIYFKQLVSQWAQHKIWHPAKTTELTYLSWQYSNLLTILFSCSVIHLAE